MSVRGTLGPGAGYGPVAHHGMAVPQGQQSPGDEHGQPYRAAGRQLLQVDVASVGAAVAGRQLLIGGRGCHQAHRGQQRHPQAIGQAGVAPFQPDDGRIGFSELLLQKPPPRHHHVGRRFLGRYAEKFHPQRVPRLRPIDVDGARRRAFQRLGVQDSRVPLPLESVPGLDHQFLAGVDAYGRRRFRVQDVNAMLPAQSFHPSRLQISRRHSPSSMTAKAALSMSMEKRWYSGSSGMKPILA